MRDYKRETNRLKQDYTLRFTPLILFLHRSESNALAKLQELYTGERLGQYVGELVAGSDVLHGDPPFFNALANEMIANIYVLAAIMMD